ncbi:nuclear transport factor 2 family protein [Lentzea sp. BCCO 10_0856]|uniref:Nuclear transport factor 2 family protein n=1 Tax=Lentzea miocenica TaxID=3095431 RepID=A0ABU4STM2_9PSEU|nr:nuclear transport factor 2 family protein [Lentzea sp. BCCO 10_0856]MDX8029261.1 nuclear transport factor 2 family protein [Lentzea sp. BCCO 10_0856]
MTSDPTVDAFIAAVNAGDRTAFFGLLTPDASMYDDGTDRDLRAWTAKEIFDDNGHMEVESSSADGKSLIIRYRNDTWGEMRTYWRFDVESGRVKRFETGQA